MLKATPWDTLAIPLLLFSQLKIVLFSTIKPGTALASWKENLLAHGGLLVLYIWIITCWEPDIVFIHEFLIPYREWASLRASERYGIKNEFVYHISHATSWEVFLAVFLFSFSLRESEISSLETFTNLQVAISIKLQSKSSRQNLTPGARHQLKYNVQPDWSNQIIAVYLIGQFKPWSDMISFHCSEIVSYHFTGIIFSHGFITL